METVFIADDEQNIREGLKYIIDWEAQGFAVCGEASNGEEALEFILKNRPSLVLLDIRMPKMYGTDLIRLSRENGYEGKFIILSGYSDFAYAQAAIRYGANFYLTKPIDEDELLQAVLHVRQALLEERSHSRNLARLQSKARNVILYELVTGRQPDGSLDGADLSALELSADSYQVVIYEKFGMEKNDASYSFAELLKVTNRGNHTFEHFTADGHDVILLKGSFALNKFQDFLEHYERRAPQKDSPLDSLFLAYGRPVKQPGEIPLSYHEAAALCSRRFFCIQGQHTLGFEELPSLDERSLEITGDVLAEYTALLTGLIQASNRKKVAEELFRLEEFLYNVKDDIASVRLFLTDLYLSVKEKITHVYSTADIPFPANAAAIEYIDNCHYLYEIIRYLSEQATMIINTAGNPSRDTVLDDVLYYIDHNYQYNIKLENIAPLFGYNSAYLGKLLSRSTGESFNSYVDHRRIDASKRLLEENRLKVYEIAEQVGYKNVDYFHKKFKKYVGVSPAEYRKNTAGED